MNSRLAFALLLSVLGLSVLRCGPPEAEVVDAGATPTDAGLLPENDAGPADAAVAADAGSAPEDAGDARNDAGQSDAGPDSGTTDAAIPYVPVVTGYYGSWTTLHP